jgi:hypothetical protein
MFLKIFIYIHLKYKLYINMLKVINEYTNIRTVVY